MKNWSESDIPILEGKIAIVTGSSSGIGLETARALAEKGATIIMAIRNLQKGEKARESISGKVDGELILMHLNLADLSSVKKFAEEFRNKFDKLDLLINNAGVMMPPYSKTKDGFELQMGTNHLGHYVLTALFFDLIKNTPNSRIVNVSSAMHKYGNINFEDINWEKRKYKAARAYGDSKLANLYFTYELARRAGEKITVAASHPGWTATDLQRHSGWMRFFNKIFAQRPAMGALPTLYAATADDVKSGDFLDLPALWK